MRQASKRADAGEKQKQQADGNIHFVEEWSADADSVARKPFGKNRKQRAGKNGDAGDEQNQIVKEETGFARDDGIELVFALQVIAILEVGSEADEQNDALEIRRTRGRCWSWQKRARS